MGQRRLFRCDACSYEAEVSGGLDVGESGWFHTAICRTCRPARLVDAIASGAADYVCPHARTRRHELLLWSHPGPCPRCGATMKRGRQTALWD